MEYNIENYKKVRETLSIQLGRDLKTKEDVNKAIKELGKSLGLIGIQGPGSGHGSHGGHGGGVGGQKGRELNRKSPIESPPKQVVVEKMYAITGFYSGGNGGDGASFNESAEVGEKGESSTSISGGSGGSGGIGFDPATQRADLAGQSGFSGFLSFIGSDTSKRQEFQELIEPGQPGGKTGDAFNRGDRLMNTVGYSGIRSNYIVNYDPNGDSRYHVYYTVRMGTMEDFLSQQQIKSNGNYYNAFDKVNMPLSDSQSLNFNHVYKE